MNDKTDAELVEWLCYDHQPKMCLRCTMNDHPLPDFAACAESGRCLFGAAMQHFTELASRLTAANATIDVLTVERDWLAESCVEVAAMGNWTVNDWKQAAHDHAEEVLRSRPAT